MSNLISLANNALKKLKFEFPYDIERWSNDMGMMIENYHKHTNDNMFNALKSFDYGTTDTSNHKGLP